MAQPMRLGCEGAVGQTVDPMLAVCSGGRNALRSFVPQSVEGLWAS